MSQQKDFSSKYDCAAWAILNISPVSAVISLAKTRNEVAKGLRLVGDPVNVLKSSMAKKDAMIASQASMKLVVAISLY